MTGTDFRRLSTVPGTCLSEDGYVAGTVRVPLPFGPASTSDGRMVSEAVDRLTAAGWDAKRFRARGDYDAFTATRDGVAVRLSARDATSFVLDVGRAQPSWVWPLAVTGFLVALITTLLALRQLDAHTRRRARVRAVTVSLLGAAAVLILPALAVGGLAANHAAISGGDPWAPPWLGFTMVGLPHGVAGRAAHGHRDPHRHRTTDANAGDRL
ncbi:hypothetical protein [Solwaraspora sp. WMMD792]|uniref:hypothetical protein n=1 Tax=Solwaraspora sp. WMMD792 TaxID=3016099 RepID=UPI002416A55C|nr:hypothetical protein [Solwaraspora sp. WMMD792]MDG4771970.1 hypothetical protein [Solwaraspora sp. WMMD792]